MPIFCPFCGEKLIDGAKFCKNCGKNVETYSGNSSDNNYQYTPPAAEKSHTLALVLGIIFDFLIPLIGIIIGVYLYTRKDSSKAKTHGLIVIALGIIIWAVSAFLGFALMIR